MNLSTRQRGDEGTVVFSHVQGESAACTNIHAEGVEAPHTAKAPRPAKRAEGNTQE